MRFMKAVIWIVDKILPITSVVGLLSLLLFNFEIPFIVFIVAIVCFVFGIFFGVAAWKYDVPPRWFWVKSKMDLFDNKIGYTIGYGTRFFWLPFAFYPLICLL